MSAVYPTALAALLQGDVDLDASTVRIVAVTSGYTYSATHDFLNDVGGGFRLGTPMALSGKTYTEGVFDADAGTYTGVAAASVIAGFVGYIDTGVEATSRLLWFENVNADGSPMSFTADGSGIPVSWPNNRVFSI